ncbi:SGS-domain-containing protein [Conidiobolus coronatus NRRL 28638]|uniref:SGS-domain-containing protein n=1 Tax=Conidiobolus coronatus (strain ATCC 28846 / CBS 209.66 / NRRL 28638) TaxID=796925 RepID=A0A137PC36_CONC2|nr:SGS-domain-containing protein [Conidiobolus coronatus NRRL 28638]|eukprot:KXN72556.1 SGS-domain-containing protein [Conidiobolus coronatus NRRL 28638]
MAANTDLKIRHEWYQNDEFVIVEVFVKQVKKEDVNIEFKENNTSILIKLVNGSEYNLELDPLSHPIVPESSEFKVLSTKVELRLKKKISSEKWNKLEGEDNLTSTLTSTEEEEAKAKSNKKNWDKIGKEAEAEFQKENDSIQNAFQQIYSNIDENAQRAMMKSFVESNGTCLSTNWDEVSKGKVKTSPPEDMVQRKYEN